MYVIVPIDGGWGKEHVVGQKRDTKGNTIGARSNNLLINSRVTLLSSVMGRSTSIQKNDF